METVMNAINGLRFRQTTTEENMNSVDSTNNSPINSPIHLSPEYSPIDSPIPPPPLHHPALRRDINIQKWNSGLRSFLKLNSSYQVWKMLTIALPFYIISVSVSTIQYFTRDEFYWFCFFLPLLSVVVMRYIYKSTHFSTALRFSYTKLSYYPGLLYEYGYIVHSVFNRENTSVCEYQYWIVMNPRTNDIEFICVVNEDYNRARKYDVIIC